MAPTATWYIVSEVFIGVLTIIGNLIVLLTFGLNKNIQKLKFAILISLGLADLAYGLAIPPAAILSYFGLPRNFYGCLLINSLLALFAAISVFNMVALTVDRYRAVKCPTDYYSTHPADASRRKVRTYLFIGAAWVGGMVVGLLPVMGWNLGPTPDGAVCSFVDVIDFQYYVYVYPVTCWVIPSIIMCMVYTYIFVSVRRRTRTSKAKPSNDAGRLEMKKLKKENYIAKTFFILFVCFAVFKLPLHIIDTYQLIHGAIEQKDGILLITLLFNHFNSTVNPVIYAYRNKAIRVAFKNTIFRVARLFFSICRIQMNTNFNGSMDSVLENS